MKKVIIFLLAVAIMVSSVSVWNPQEVQAASGDVYASGNFIIEAVKGDNAVYFTTDWSSKIKKYDIKKKKVTTIAKTKNSSYYNLAYCDGYLYYKESASKKEKICRFDAKKGKSKSLTSVDSLNGKFFLYNGKIYYSFSKKKVNTIASMNYNGTDKKNLLTDKKNNFYFSNLYEGLMYSSSVAYDIANNKLVEIGDGESDSIESKVGISSGDGIKYSFVAGGVESAEAKYSVKNKKVYKTDISTKKKVTIYTATKSSSIQDLIPAGNYLIVAECNYKTEYISLILINSKGKKVKVLDRYEGVFI